MPQNDPVSLPLPNAAKSAVSLSPDQDEAVIREVNLPSHKPQAGSGPTTQSAVSVQRKPGTVIHDNGQSAFSYTLSLPPGLHSAQVRIQSDTGSAARRNKFNRVTRSLAFSIEEGHSVEIRVPGMKNFKIATTAGEDGYLDVGQTKIGAGTSVRLRTERQGVNLLAEADEQVTTDPAKAAANPDLERQAFADGLVHPIRSMAEYRRIRADALRLNMPVAIEFTAQDAAGSANGNPEFQEAAKSSAGKMRFISVDIASVAELAEKYKVQGTPTTVVIEPREASSGFNMFIKSRNTGSLTREQVVSPTEVSDLEKLNPQLAQIIELCNIERARRGLRVLVPDPQLLKNAQRKAEWMASTGRLEHGNPGCAENIAWNQANSDAVMRSWMSSRGHRRNILNSRHTSIGVGVANAGHGPYWCQQFR